jgi:hypothetical protein
MSRYYNIDILMTLYPSIYMYMYFVAQIPSGPGCDKLCAITAVAKSKPQTNPNASVCPKGVLTSNDALPMNCCKLNASNTWQKGAKVIFCFDNNDIHC